MSPAPPSEGIAELAWRVETSRAGAPTLQLGGRSVHSRYDPRAEAHTLAERTVGAMQEQGARLLILIGEGLGYLPEALRARCDAPILLWEPFPELAAALPNPTPAALPGVVRVADSEGFARALADRARLLAPPHLVVHPGYEELCRFEARFAARELRRVFRAERPLWIEEATVSQRALDCLSRFPELPTVERLEGALRGQTAIVVSPGPSLLPALPMLRARRGGVVLAAVQALRALHGAGVRVDFALAPDPRDYTPYVQGLDPRFGVLLADTAVDPRLLDRWRGRSLLFHLRSPHLQQVVWEACGLPILDEPFVTVSEIGLVLARHLGARRLVMVGVDLDADTPAYPVRFWARNAAGEPVRTNSTYFHAARYLSALCPRLEREGCPVWRWGEGLPIRGVRPADPERLRALLDEAPPFPWEAPRAHVDAGRWKRARDAIRSVQASVGARRWAAGRVSGAHAETDDLAPLPEPERALACKQALAQLDANPPRE